MDPIETLLTRLGHASRSYLSCGYGSYIAQCPSHGDARPSLSIRRGDDGRALVYCQAGCSFLRILDSLGLRPGDLFASAAASPRPRAVSSKFREYPTAEAAEAAATPEGSTLQGSWRYRAIDGREAFQVLLFDGSAGPTHRTIHRQMGGLWRPGDPSGPLPLYRLPELLADPDATVWVGERETVADTLIRCELLATTSALGWRSAGKTDWSPLSGRTVVLLPDHSAPGLSFARDVASRLLSLDRPAEVRILSLPLLSTGESFEHYNRLLPDHWEPRAVASHMIELASGTRVIDSFEQPISRISQ